VVLLLAVALPLIVFGAYGLLVLTGVGLLLISLVSLIVGAVALGMALEALLFNPDVGWEEFANGVAFGLALIGLIAALFGLATIAAVVGVIAAIWMSIVYISNQFPMYDEMLQ
jgi:hypothetical protein